LQQDDLARLRHEYLERERRLKGSDRYSLYNPAALFLFQERQRLTLRLLRKHGYDPLHGQRILELGCGKGEVLREYLGYGVHPEHLFGTDLLPDRVVEARKNLPFLPLTCSDGQNLPYPSGYFDLVLQYTVFSSILDYGIRAKIAKELLRVLKPEGAVIWYDFWTNPINPQTRGIQPKEIRDLFPECQMEFQRLTLAPPLTRRLVPISWILAELVSRMGIFNTHYLVVIRRNSTVKNI